MGEGDGVLTKSQTDSKVKKEDQVRRRGRRVCARPIEEGMFYTTLAMVVIGILIIVTPVLIAKRICQYLSWSEWFEKKEPQHQANANIQRQTESATR